MNLASADAMKEDQDLNFIDFELAAEESDPDQKPWVPDFELEEGEDAMTRMGYGVVSYFGIIHTFMLVLFLITCVNIPIMLNNS